MKYALLEIEHGALTAYLLDETDGRAPASKVSTEETISGPRAVPWIQGVAANAAAAANRSPV
jgi:hypothetical protein